MPGRRERIFLAVLGLVVLGWMAAQALLGVDTGVLYVAPAFVLALPLLGGRYVGEEHLARLRGPLDACVQRAPLRVAPRVSHVRVLMRGGRLVASSLAKRPPPAGIAVLA